MLFRSTSLGSESSLTGIDEGQDVLIRAAFTYGKRVLPKGSATILIPMSSGDLYLIKTNSITSVTVATAGSPRTATVYAKANICRISSGGCVAAIDGNVSVRIDLTDGVPDRVGITATSSKTGALYYSNDWVKTGKAWATIQAMLSFPDYATIL